MPILIALFSVVFILYLSYLFSKYVATRTFQTSRSKCMKVIDVLALGQDKQVIIVELSNRFFLLGVTATNINMISELDEENLSFPSDDKGDGNSSNVDFKNMITKLMPQKRK